MTSTNHQGEQDLDQQPFVSHLLELSHRLKRVLVVVLVLFLGLFPWANDLYTLLANPLISQLPEGTSMIATKVIAPFLTPLKLTFVLAIFLAIPFILYQFWAFIAPGLYKHEKRLAMPLVASSAFLFYLGASFAYFVVFPLLFQILPSMAPDQITVAPDITDYLDFVLTLFFAFGFAFEVPIATIILVWMGMTTPASLAQKRPYIIVGAFCIGMLLTPPDVISQTLLAVPMWVLFELGVIFSRFFVREQESAEGSAEDDEVVAVEPVSTESSAERGSGLRQPTVLPLNDPPAKVDVGAEDEGVDEPTVSAPAEFKPLTEAELKAQLDVIESEEDYWDEGYDDEEMDAPVDPSKVDAKTRVDAKLELVMEYRNVENEDAARKLLYEVLAEGDEDQIRVARNVLQQLDSD
jgi:sec-independent protein translocase protein TatC